MKKLIILNLIILCIVNIACQVKYVQYSQCPNATDGFLYDTSILCNSRTKEEDAYFQIFLTENKYYELAWREVDAEIFSIRVMQQDKQERTSDIFINVMNTGKTSIAFSGDGKKIVCIKFMFYGEYRMKFSNITDDDM